MRLHLLVLTKKYKYKLYRCVRTGTFVHMNSSKLNFHKRNKGSVWCCVFTTEIKAVFGAVCSLRK